AGSGASVPGEYALNTAQLIAMLPHSVFVLSVATVLFNRLSHQHSAGAVDDVRSTVSSGLRTIGVASVFGAAAVVVLAGPLARLFAGSGPTAAASAASMGQVLAIVAAGMPFMSIYFFLGRVFYAEEDAKTPLIMQALCSGASVLLAVLIAWLVDPTMVVYALALLFAVFHVVSAVLAHHFARRRLGDYGAGRVVDTYIRLGYAALGSGLVGAAVLGLLGGYATGGFAWQSIVAAMVTIAVVGLVMAVVYLLLLRALRVQELQDFLAPIMNRLPGRA
ncbi:MAG TPA: lipid II flippase MurJ, partial [Arthrobacter sp.]|nr:lipid II flippase MurJ [Arthrobacter sp.]